MLVGVLGFIGSGKGTAGDILSDMGFESLSFAGAVKDVTAVMFNWPRDLLEGDTDESRTWREQPDKFWSKNFGKDFTPRLALQLMGTEVGRDVFHENFWVLNLESKMKGKKKNYVITDVRFPNEMEFVHRQGGVLIEIQRGAMPHWYDIAEKANHGDYKAEQFLRKEGIHESEWRWIGGDIDFTIHNMGSKEELKTKLTQCLTKVYGQSTISELLEGVTL
jgi:hypothetical protein